jgi:methyltransferase (TIGR00027 family)
MEENQAGITALVTAYTRAYHAANETHKIFDDFLAGRLFTPEEHISFRRNIAGLLPFVDPQAAAANPDEQTALLQVMQTYNGSITLSRSRYTEDCLEQPLAEGLGQYVILGAGMDTFAYRHPELTSRLQVFEVDHPVTQAIKRQRLELFRTNLPSNLHLIPINFGEDDLKTALLEAGYVPEKPGFFSWLGVTFYLTLDAIQSTFGKLSELAAPGSSLIFDYMDKDAFDLEKSVKRMQLMQMITRQAGEPMKTGFDLTELEADLKKFGFRLHENLSPAEIEACYFANRDDDYHAFEHVHFARALKV